MTREILRLYFLFQVHSLKMSKTFHFRLKRMKWQKIPISFSFRRKFELAEIILGKCLKAYENLKWIVLLISFSDQCQSQDSCRQEENNSRAGPPGIGTPSSSCHQRHRLLHWVRRLPTVRGRLRALHSRTTSPFEFSSSTQSQNGRHGHGPYQNLQDADRSK